MKPESDDNPFANVVVFDLTAPGDSFRRASKDDFNLKDGRDFIAPVEQPPDTNECP